MKVKELIAKLNSFNMDAEVSISLDTGNKKVPGEFEYSIEDGDFVDAGNTQALYITAKEKVASVDEMD